MAHPLFGGLDLLASATNPDIVATAMAGLERAGGRSTHRDVVGVADFRRPHACRACIWSTCRAAASRACWSPTAADRIPSIPAG